MLEAAPGEWTVLNLPAIATRDEVIQIGPNRIFRRAAGDILHPQREPRSVLEQLRRDIGADAFEAQYQQEPVPPGGAMFKRKWLRRYGALPEPGDDAEIVQSWDTASKTGPANDWSVCTTWLVKGGEYYLLDLFRERLDYPQLKAAALGLAHTYGPRIVIVEDSGVGTGLVAELRALGVNVLATMVTASKQARASIKSAMFEGGRVLFPERASWLSELEAELLSFPEGRHDDQVDSIVQALDYVPEEPVGVLWLNFRRW